MSYPNITTPAAAAYLSAVVASSEDAIFASDLYSQVFVTVAQGIGITIAVTLIAFGAASAIGLGVALMALSGSVWMPNTLFVVIDVRLPYAPFWRNFARSLNGCRATWSRKLRPNNL